MCVFKDGVNSLISAAERREWLAYFWRNFEQGNVFRVSKKNLKPVLSDGDILLLNNSLVHKSKLVSQTLADLKIKHLFLTRYSPDLNPIELLWAFIKNYLRKMKARTAEKLDAAVAETFDLLLAEYSFNWCKFLRDLLTCAAFYEG